MKVSFYIIIGSLIINDHARENFVFWGLAYLIKHCALQFHLTYIFFQIHEFLGVCVASIS